MATKAQIKAKIQAMLTLNAGITDRSEHEQFLHTDTDSILEAIYPLPKIENSSITTTVTTSNANFSYILVFSKRGSAICINGKITSNINTSAISKVFDITDSEYDQIDTIMYTQAFNSLNGNIIEVYTNNLQSLYTNGTITIGEAFTFNLTYNALN